MSRRPGGAFDPDDKYSKAKAQNVRSHATPPPVKSRGGVQGDVPRFASQQSSPAQSAESSEMAARVRSKLDAVADRLHGDERESSADLVKGSLDRLAFASQVSQVTDAFGSVGHDALDEVGSLANKATETVALFQAAQYASKWMPIDTHLTMKPTYVKVAAQSAERIKWYEDAAFESIVAAHADERDAILAENAGLRGMLGLEETSSENVARIRETEDGVNRALLMSAAEEIKRLRARELVLEGEAARRRVKDSGFFSFGGGGADGVDTAQMTRLTTELARLEEDNGRQRWMIGEKDKQIKETQAKFAASEAYALRERLQECTEALQVAANLQAEQLQYLEDNALKKLLKLDDQICDVQDDLDTRAHQLEQLRDVLHHYWAAGDERVAPTVASLAGFARDARTNLFSLKEKREAKTLGGIVTGLGRFGAKLGGGGSRAASQGVRAATGGHAEGGTGAGAATERKGKRKRRGARRAGGDARGDAGGVAREARHVGRPRGCRVPGRRRRLHSTPHGGEDTFLGVLVGGTLGHRHAGEEARVRGDARFRGGVRFFVRFFVRRARAGGWRVTLPALFSFRLRFGARPGRAPRAPPRRRDRRGEGGARAGEARAPRRRERGTAGSLRRRARSPRPGGKEKG